MQTLDLLYSGLIYGTAAMLFLCAGMLLTAAFLVLAPSRKSACLHAAPRLLADPRAYDSSLDSESSQFAARSS